MEHISYSKRWKCSVCGKPVKRKGIIHALCRKAAGLDNKWSNHSKHEIHRSCDRLIKRIDADLTEKAKHWTPSMGKEKLLEMFPDMVGRV